MSQKECWYAFERLTVDTEMRDGSIRPAGGVRALRLVAEDYKPAPGEEKHFGPWPADLTALFTPEAREREMAKREPEPPVTRAEMNAVIEENRKLKERLDKIAPETVEEHIMRAIAEAK